MKLIKIMSLGILLFTVTVQARFTVKIPMVLEPKIAEFVKVLESKGGKPIYTLPAVEARKILEDIQAIDVKKLPAHIEDLMIPGADGKISVRIVRPQNSTGTLPIIIYCHGGGWILGSKDTHDRLIREIANGAQAAVVFVNFTLSPEAKFPVAIEQIYATTKYFAENAAKHNMDSNRLVIAGDSVGGNMATVVTMLAKERQGPTINFQLLFYPVTDANFQTMSYQRFAQGPWLTKPSMEWFWNAYEPNVAARKNYKLSPLRASLDQLKGLPPALIITNENDVLRNEGESYARKLMQAGVDVVAIRIIGSIHDLVLLNPIADSLAARSAIALATMHLKKALGN